MKMLSLRDSVIIIQICFFLGPVAMSNKARSLCVRWELLVPPILRDTTFPSHVAAFSWFSSVLGIVQTPGSLPRWGRSYTAVCWWSCPEPDKPGTLLQREQKASRALRVLDLLCLCSLLVPCVPPPVPGDTPDVEDTASCRPPTSSSSKSRII